MTRVRTSRSAPIHKGLSTMADMKVTEKKQDAANTPERIEELVAKLVQGDASKKDVADLQALSASAAQRLRPSPPPPVFAGLKAARRRFA